jgi:hypothetical protein
MYSLDFTECKENSRGALIKPSNCSSSSYIFLPSTPCMQECPAGAFLSYSPSSQSLTCEFCKSGTFSIGGGLHLSSWNSHKQKLLSYCYVLEKTGWEVNGKCTSWHSSKEEYLVSGRSIEEKWYQAVLVLYPVLVKKGSFRMTYKKHVQFEAGQDSGEFMVFINNELKFVDLSTRSNKWNRISIELEVGVYDIQIVFNALVSDKPNEVQIREIQVRGTEYASHRCEACFKGSSLSGADSCEECETGSYLEKDPISQVKVCRNCPPGTSSPAGSVGIEECKPLNQCGDQDFNFIFTDCQNGNRTKIYEWNFPLMCSNEGLSLPGNQQIPCASCPAGTISNGDSCQECPEGYYREENTENQCKPCKAGYFAAKFKVFEDWSTIPESFESSCKTSSNSDCEYSWETRGTYIRSSPFYGSDWSVLIEKVVQVSHSESFFSFDFTIQGFSTVLSVEVNSVVVKSFQGLMGNTTKVPLSKGENRIIWSCVHNSSADEVCSIHKITFVGTEEGGAASCIQCPAGYFSFEKQSICTACPAGQTSKESNEGCTSCLWNTFSEQAGRCETCAPSTVPSSDHSHCLLPSNLSLNNQTFFIGKLSGSENETSEYCKEPRLELDCHKSFFGPVQQNNSFFYLSVGNPSYPDLPSYPLYFNEKSYAFALLELENFPEIDLPALKPSSKSTCFKDYSKVLVNLGSRISNVEETENGFNLTYSNGTACKEGKSFKVNIEFLCRKEELEGWPVFRKAGECEIWFFWPTVHACRECREGDIQRKEGQCDRDRREVHLVAKDYCLFSGFVSYKSQEEKCKSTPYYSKTMFLVSAIIAGVMVLLILAMIGLTIRTRFGYDRAKLLETSKEEMSPRDDISPGTPEEMQKNKVGNFTEAAHKVTDRE